MILAEYTDIEIAGMACCVPTHTKTLEEYYSEFGQENVDKFSKTTGVVTRRIAAPKQTTSDLAYAAACKIMLEKHVEPKEIGILVLVTQSPDYRMPATAYVLQNRLGLPEKCLCFDVNLGCSGFIYGVNIVSSLMDSNGITKGLLLFGDTPSKFTAPLDKSACMLSGDAAGAVLLEQKRNAPIMRLAFRSMGESYRAIAIYAGAYRNMDASHASRLYEDGSERSAYDLNMNGVEVFSNMIAKAPILIKNYLEHFDRTLADYDALMLHQANLYIIKQIAKRIGCPMDKIPITIDRYGNTSSAAIPITISDAYGETENEKKSLLMCGLGGGLSLGLIDTQLNTNVVFPVFCSDEYYEDGVQL